jgi:tetratricopeptide (TPR) repeat protein
VSEARPLILEAAARFKSLGDRASEAGTLGNLSNIDFQEGAYENALSSLEEAANVFREVGHRAGLTDALLGLGYTLLALQRASEAREFLGEALELALAASEMRETIVAAGVIALASDELVPAARLRGATAALRQQHQVLLDPAEERFEQDHESALVAKIGRPDFERESTLGKSLSMEHATQLARQLARPREKPDSSDAPTGIEQVHAV